ncbi:ABC transporter permease [Clostridium beijerinckii]|uniref:ABC transporter permease n=1 Tax=Clostridium beijerinckii TaxID=1520 RepID=UPI00098BD3E0|nr:ABC transporter permease [Clostridium beijerinckii]NRT78699.1 spermidine/putrescine transport system permease protein [Clostridium beijerinckii]OOM49450.1 spermidine/putrescine transport system permease protein PotB [Clostridium beijerinckii]
MKSKKKINMPLITTVGPVSSWMILLVAIPFIYVFAMSFMNKGAYGGVVIGFTLNNFIQVFDPLYLKVFGESLLISAFATIICIVIAYPFTYFIAQKTTIKKTVFMAMVIVPFLVSSLIRLFGWINLLRKDGIINSLLLKLGLINEPLQLVYNTTGVMIGLVYMLLPFMILPLYSSIEKLDKSLLEACSDLGSRPITSFIKVTLPLTMPGIFAGSILVFIPSLGYFFVTDLLGGSKTQVIGNVIRTQFITARNWPLGSAISIFLIVITLVLVWLYQKSGGNMDDLGGM